MMRTATTDLSQRIRLARRHANLTQLGLAKACGVTRGAVALWESALPEHRSRPSLEHMQTISQACGVPFDWLMNDDADMNAYRPDRILPAVRGPTTLALNANNLPDLRQKNHLFVFAQTAEQIAAKLKQIAALPPGIQAHLVLIGAPAVDVRTVSNASDALAAAVQILTHA